MKGIWVLGLAAVGLYAVGCKYQDKSVGPYDRTTMTALGEPYKHSSPAVGRVQRGPSQEEGAGTPRTGVIEGQLERRAKFSMDVVSGGQTVRLLTDSKTKTIGNVKEGSQVRASYEVAGEEKVARDIEPLPAGK